ncbi:MAG: response regulator, partial [Myxococcota bacterium]
MQLQRERLRAHHEKERKALAAWQRRGQTILLVEDDAELRRMLASALRRDGYSVEEAANGDAALDWLDAGVRVGNL